MKLIIKNAILLIFTILICFNISILIVRISRINIEAKFNNEIRRFNFINEGLKDLLFINMNYKIPSNVNLLEDGLNNSIVICINSDVCFSCVQQTIEIYNSFLNEFNKQGYILSTQKMKGSISELLDIYEFKNISCISISEKKIYNLLVQNQLLFCNIDSFGNPNTFYLPSTHLIEMTERYLEDIAFVSEY